MLTRKPKHDERPQQHSFGTPATGAVARFDPTMKTWLPNSRRNTGSKVFNPGMRKKMAERRARPILMNESLHVVMRSDLARGKLSLRRHEKKIAALVKKLAKTHGVHIHKLANVGNHIHIHLRVTRRLRWKGFISGLAGGIARAVGYQRNGATTRAPMTVGHQSKKTKPNNKPSSGFWNARPYTRTVSRGYDFRLIQDYVHFNQLEADGVVPPRQQMRTGKSWRRILALWRDD